MQRKINYKNMLDNQKYPPLDFEMYCNHTVNYSILTLGIKMRDLYVYKKIGFIGMNITTF